MWIAPEDRWSVVPSSLGTRKPFWLLVLVYVEAEGADSIGVLEKRCVVGVNCSKFLRSPQVFMGLGIGILLRTWVLGVWLERYLVGWGSIALLGLQIAGEKTVSFCYSMSTGGSSGHMAGSGETILLPVIESYRTPLAVSAEGKTLSQQELLTVSGGSLLYFSRPWSTD